MTESREPAALSAWHRDRLGIAGVPSIYDEQPWRQEAGMWMIDFRVRDPGAMIAELRAAGISVDPEQTYAQGRFARLYDP